MEVIFLKKLIARTVLTLGLCASLASTATAYQRHEHKFGHIGSGYSQSAGNAKCNRLFVQRKYPWYMFGKYLNVYANDGTVITWSRHIWYHRNNGDCIANK